MKWTAPRSILLAPIVIPIVITTSLAQLLLVGALWLGRRIARAARPPAEWGRWYAWRPVRISDPLCADEGAWVWLEHVERRRDRRRVKVRTIGRALPVAVEEQDRNVVALFRARDAAGQKVRG